MLSSLLWPALKSWRTTVSSHPPESFGGVRGERKSWEGVEGGGNVGKGEQEERGQRMRESRGEEKEEEKKRE
jgi:hypothetical protein